MMQQNVATPVAGKKRKTKSSDLPSEGSGNGPQESPKKKKSAKPKKPLDSRFGGKTEEELMELFLPDHLKPDLDIVFMGINPGLLSAYLGHHYCNASNHFWPCMYESGLVPRRMTYKDDKECLDHGIGFTNIVPRTTRSSNDLSRKEMKDWSGVMINRMKELKPLIVCFNGKGIYEIFIGKKCEVGLQPVPLPDTTIAVYVMPSSSGRAASHPRRVDKLKFFNELKELRDNLKKKYNKTESSSQSPLTTVSTAIPITTTPTTELMTTPTTELMTTLTTSSVASMDPSITGPVATPITGPVATPTTGPVATPITGTVATPITGTVATPITSSVGMSIVASMGPPITGPVTTPMTSFTTTPITSSVLQQHHGLPWQYMTTEAQGQLTPAMIPTTGSMFPPSKYTMIPSSMVPPSMVAIPPSMVPSSMVSSSMVPPSLVPSSMVPSSMVSSSMVPPSLVPSSMVPSSMMPPSLVPSSMVPSSMMQGLVPSNIPYSLATPTMYPMNNQFSHASSSGSSSSSYTPVIFSPYFYSPANPRHQQSE